MKFSDFTLKLSGTLAVLCEYTTKPFREKIPLNLPERKDNRKR
jgi:hypothetical protein